MQPDPVPSVPADHEPSAQSASWCCAWHTRIPAGATDASMASCSFSASQSPPPPSGRSSKTPGSAPAPERTSTTWSAFLRSQAEALLACDFFETRTLSGARLHVLHRHRPLCPAAAGHNGRRPYCASASAPRTSTNRVTHYGEYPLLHPHTVTGIGPRGGSALLPLAELAQQARSGGVAARPPPRQLGSPRHRQVEHRLPVTGFSRATAAGARLAPVATCLRRRAEHGSRRACRPPAGSYVASKSVTPRS